MGMIMHDDVPYGEGTSYTQGTSIAINNNVIAVDADNVPTSGGEKPVKSKGVYDALVPKVSESLLKDTVGWTGKNKLKYDKWKGCNVSGGTCVYEDYGVTLTATTNDCFTSYGTGSNEFPAEARISVEAGKTYILTWDCDKDTEYGIVMIFPNGSTTGRAYTYNNTKRLEYTAASGVTFVTFRCGINNHNGSTVKYSNIMFREASISDSTFEPYHESVEEVVEQIYADNGVLGAKNLLPINATTQTINDVTLTVNADGSIIANGTASAEITLMISPKIPLAKYVLSGCPAGGSTAKYMLQARLEYSGTWYRAAYDIGSGVEITDTDLKNANLVQIAIIIKNGQACNNLTFRPMFRLASDPDDTYVPYAMTNRELTQEKLSISELKTIASSAADFAAFKTAIANL